MTVQNGNPVLKKLRNIAIFGSIVGTGLYLAKPLTEIQSGIRIGSSGTARLVEHHAEQESLTPRATLFLPRAITNHVFPKQQSGQPVPIVEIKPLRTYFVDRAQAQTGSQWAQIYMNHLWNGINSRVNQANFERYGMNPSSSDQLLYRYQQIRLWNLMGNGKRDDLGAMKAAITQTRDALIANPIQPNDLYNAADRQFTLLTRHPNPPVIPSMPNLGIEQAPLVNLYNQAINELYPPQARFQD